MMREGFCLSSNLLYVLLFKEKKGYSNFVKTVVQYI